MRFALPPTATYAARLVEWVPTVNGDGALVIRLRKRSGGTEEADCYAVEEQDSGEPDVREWLLLNATDESQKDVYRVSLGRVESCTCTAGQVKRHECKHLAAMRAITGEDGMRARTHRGTTYTISEAHPAAERFPWLDENELQELADDISENGQEVLILRLPEPDLRIVDGRNRELACFIAGVEPQYREEEFGNDAEIIARVKSRNIHRRHLSTSQRAAIAAEFATRPQGFQGQEKDAALHLSPTQSEAAAQLGVSKRSVANAAKVKDEAPEVFSLVKDGSLDVHTAAKVASLPKRKRKKVATADDPKAEAAKQLEEQQSTDPREELIARINKLCHAIDAAKKEAVAIAAEPFGRHVHAESVVQQLEAARKALWQARPTEACNCVKGGAEPKPQCKACFGSGRCPASRVLKGGR